MTDSLENLSDEELHVIVRQNSNPHIAESRHNKALIELDIRHKKNIERLLQSSEKNDKGRAPTIRKEIKTDDTFIQSRHQGDDQHLLLGKRDGTANKAHMIIDKDNGSIRLEDDRMEPTEVAPHIETVITLLGGRKIRSTREVLEEVTPKAEKNQNTHLPIIVCWGVPEEHQENEKILAYEFELMLQNKTDEILKDIWINFSSSGFNLQVEETKQTVLFEGWNIHEQALNLITKDSYRFPPQNILVPLKIKILIKKELLPEEAWIYYSYGCPNMKKIEKKVRITKKDLEVFIAGQKRDVKTFLRMLKLGN